LFRNLQDAKRTRIRFLGNRLLPFCYLGLPTGAFRTDHQPSCLSDPPPPFPLTLFFTSKNVLLLGVVVEFLVQGPAQLASPFDHPHQRPRRPFFQRAKWVVRDLSSLFFFPLRAPPASYLTNFATFHAGTVKRVRFCKSPPASPKGVCLFCPPFSLMG